MKIIRGLFAGIAGAIAMSAVMFLIREQGINVNLEALLGSLFVPSSNISPWMFGFILHLCIGAVMALLYSVAFEVVHISGPLMGGGLGIAHGLMAGLFMSGIPAMNPVIADFSSPGPFLSNLKFGPILFLLVHFIYGAVVGLVYGPPLHRPELTPKQVTHG